MNVVSAVVAIVGGLAGLVTLGGVLVWGGRFVGRVDAVIEKAEQRFEDAVAGLTDEVDKLRETRDEHIKVLAEVVNQVTNLTRMVGDLQRRMDRWQEMHP